MAASPSTTSSLLHAIIYYHVMFTSSRQLRHVSEKKLPASGGHYKVLRYSMVVYIIRARRELLTLQNWATIARIGAGSKRNLLLYITCIYECFEIQ